ncbi:ferrous iron transport protein A [uncultured Clostridium sp.]|uniref:FeoA family protein n=1 Tax=uncultured Clostridium sp. TaxID=59620 RepID=UPI0025E20C3F|nr:ferrous iron transport protein A [uncultured Clostridium sp.]
MSILNLNPGQKGIISEINGNSKLTKRLSALGCIEGTSIEFKRKAPLGDPLIINFRGFDLAIRKKDAQCIILENI